MKIPVYEQQSEFKPAYVNEGAATATGRALQGFAQGMEQAGGDLFQVAKNNQAVELYQQKIDEIEAKNQAFSLAVDANKSLGELNSGLDKIPNHREYRDAADKGFKKIAKETIDSVKNPLVKEHLNSYFQKEYMRWTDQTITKADKRFTDSMQAEDVKRFDEALKSQDPAQFALAMGGLDANIQGGIYPADVGAKLKIEYQKHFNAAVDNGNLAAQERRLAYEPDKLHWDILSGALNGVITDPKKRADLELRAVAATKILENERKAKLKEEIKQEHDSEERAVGEAFLKGEFTQAYSLLTSSKNLTGDELKTWKNALETASKEKAENVDPFVEAAEYSQIMRYMNMPDLDKDVLRDSIIISPRLGKAKKFELLKDLETEENTETKAALDWAFKYGYPQIVPHSGWTALPDKTPEEEQKNMLFQRSIKDWVRGLQNQKKAPSPKEIMDHAMGLVPFFQTKVEKKIETLETQADEVQKGFVEAQKRKEEAKNPQKPVPPSLAPKKYDATATNPQTGQKMGLIGGKWEPISK